MFKRIQFVSPHLSSLFEDPSRLESRLKLGLVQDAAHTKGGLYATPQCVEKGS